MTPDIDELIKRINSLTLDKNRLKQRLVQLQGNSNNNSNTAISHEHLSRLKNLIDSSDLSSGKDADQSAKEPIPSINTSASTDATKSPDASTNSSPASQNRTISGIKCTTSCEEDLLYLNELYKSRLEDYDANWEYVQSKCIALGLEMNALQKQFALLREEKNDMEKRYKSKCDDLDRIKGELQTVSLNYETQLSAMSDHLSMLANRTSVEDD